MIVLIILLFCILASLGVGALAAWSDVKTLRIPNCYSLIVMVLFALAYSAAYLGGVHLQIFMPLKIHILTMVVVFILTYVMFYFGVLGGGDSKLLTAFSLWVGLKGALALLFYMSLAGFVLGVFALFLKKKTPFKPKNKEGWIARTQNGENKLPYAVAIFVGVLASYAVLGYISLDTFVSLL